MKKIIIDFEMNCIPKREIIEVGAVKLDETNCVVSEFHSYVKPENELNERIVRITGIHNADVKDAPTLGAVLNEFFEWCGDDYIIYSWSKNDLQQLMDETVAKLIFNSDLDKAFLHWRDYQFEFGQLINYPGELSLRNAVAAVGHSLKGKHHSAIDDARNTAEIFIFASEANNSVLNTIRDLFTPKKVEASIGELFPKLSSLLYTTT